MGPLATIVCLGFVGYLYWRELRSPDHDRLSWAPFAWMFFAGSRFPSAWLDLRGPALSVEAYAEGSPADRTVFLLLILWGSWTLSRRQIDWAKLVNRNKWLIAYFVYCLVSIFWTDEPTVLAKRWIKDLGNPIMALVLLTEHKPFDAVVTTVRRLAFFALPVSILFIRYYPEFGRGYTSTGGMMYSGIADQKNTLGLFCLIAGLCYIWASLYRKESRYKQELVLAGLLAWLLSLSNSKTSLACLAIAAGILIVSRFSWISGRPRRLLTATVSGSVFYLIGDSLFQVQDQVLNLLGRDSTLTNRTEVWGIVSALQTNALVGTGFMSFWAGDRMAAVWTALGPGINQAHNGYLEQYLNLGYIGVAFIIVIAAATLLRIRQELDTQYDTAVLRLCILVVALLYNYTEASFYGINNMWVLFLVASINYPKPHAAAVPLRAIGALGLSPRHHRFRIRVNSSPRPQAAQVRPASDGTGRAVPARRRGIGRAEAPLASRRLLQ
jgi:exopolysaccharide production protein ExoQ